jgi:hypothetical protein
MFYLFFLATRLYHDDLCIRAYRLFGEEWKKYCRLAGKCDLLNSKVRGSKFVLCFQETSMNECREEDLNTCIRFCITARSFEAL